MLTIRALSGGETYASRHLSANDYYAEGERIQGYWMGHGAELLELKGEVTMDQFDAIRQGNDPKTGEFLRPRQNVNRFDKDGERLSSARNLYDFTVSAPKSVSVQALVDPRLRDAHTQVLLATPRRLVLKEQPLFSFRKFKNLHDFRGCLRSIMWTRGDSA